MELTTVFDEDRTASFGTKIVWLAKNNEPSHQILKMNLMNDAREKNSTKA